MPSRTHFKNRMPMQLSKQSRRRRIFVGEQLRLTDLVVGVAQAQLSAFRSRARVYSSKDKLEAQQSGLNGVEMRREELGANRKMFGGLLTALHEHPSRNGLQALVASPGLAENPVVLQLYGKLASYQARRDSLSRWVELPVILRCCAWIRC